MASKPHVCRRLFPDEEGIVRAPEERPSSEDEQRPERERWNFDFVRGVPLPGKWEWERVVPPPRTDPGTIESIGGGVAEGSAEGPRGPEVGVKLNLECGEEGVKGVREGVGERAKEEGEEEEEETFPSKSQPDEEYNVQNSRDPSSSLGQYSKSFYSGNSYY